MNRFLALLVLLIVVLGEKNYTDVVLTLNSAIKNKSGEFYHKAYDRLALWSDTFGPRMWGSDVLEMAIKDVYNQALA